MREAKIMNSQNSHPSPWPLPNSITIKKTMIFEKKNSNQYNIKLMK